MIFVEEPFHDLIHTTSRFWNASGITVATGASGIEVQVASLQALLIGGDQRRHARRCREGRGRSRRRALSALCERAHRAQAQFTEKLPFLVYFDGSVRG